MKLIINQNPVTLPSSLAEVTLGQRIDFQLEHGKQLDEMLVSIMDMEDEFDRELELKEFQAEKMFRTFAFFTGCTVEALRESDFVDDVAVIYLTSELPTLLEDNEPSEFQKDFLWNNETWVLPEIELKQGSKMTTGEFVDSKQTIQNMHNAGKSKWETILHLSAIFLRKQGEEYCEDFIYDGSERLELMMSLPLDIAMQVSFFLTKSIHLYRKLFPYSGNHGQKQAESLAESILKGGGGSTSLRVLQANRTFLGQEVVRTAYNARAKQAFSMC